MALSNNWGQRTSLLCAMYVAQGLPWGFMLNTVVSYITDTDEDVTATQIGRLTAMILYPWTFKLIWAPLIDSATIRSMGRRRPWIIGAQLMMAVSLLSLIMMGDITKNIVLLGWMFFLHNCFASLQDVATDALAVDILPANEQGRVNGLMWASKLLGKGIGTAAGGWLIAHYGFTAAVLAQFCSLFVIMFFPLLLVERPGERRLPWSAGQASDVGGATSLRSPLTVLRDLVKGFSLPTTALFVVFGLSAVIGWGVIEVLTKPLFTRDLDWTAAEYAYWTGAAVFLEIGAAVSGGLLADRFGRRIIIAIGLGGYGLLAIAYAALPNMWTHYWFSAGFLCINPGFIAIGAVGYNSMGMKLSWTRSSATMFTVYMTLSNVGHVLGNELFGRLRDQWQYSFQETLFVGGTLMLVPLVLLFGIRPGDVDRARDEYAAGNPQPQEPRSPLPGPVESMD
jgi:PAT family beta-lactamase induction signal transducer AmpG